GSSGVLPEERGGGLVEPLPRGHLEVDQAGQREVHLGDLVEVDLLTQPTQPVQLLGGQRQRCRTTQLTPLVTLKFDIRAALADPRHCSLLARRWASVYGLAHEHSTLGARRAQRAVTFYTVIVARLTLRGPAVLAILREHFLPRGGDLPGACRRGDPADTGAETGH